MCTSVVVITGPSGVGKRHAADMICKEFTGFERAVSYTTRNRLDDEKNGLDYFFVSQDVFQGMVDSQEIFDIHEKNVEMYGQSLGEINRILRSGKQAIVHAITEEGLKFLQSYYGKRVQRIHLTADPDTLNSMLKMTHPNLSMKERRQILIRICSDQNRLALVGVPIIPIHTIEGDLLKDTIIENIQKRGPRLAVGA